MTGDYSFETQEVDGAGTVVANPVSEDAEPVELSSTWATDDDVEGKWENAVHAVLDATLFDLGTVGDGVVRVDRSTVVGALVERLDDLRDEQQADALVAYLATAGVWTVDGDDVDVLRDPRETSLSGCEALAWAAALDACADRVDEIRNDLAQSTDGMATHSEADGLLSSIGDALDVKRSEVRTRAIQQREFPDDATRVTDSFAELVAGLAPGGAVGETLALVDVSNHLAGVGDVDEAVENTSDKEFAEMVENTSDKEFAEMVEDEVVDLDMDTDLEQPDEGGSRVD
jgi:hypothetical protein